MVVSENILLEQVHKIASFVWLILVDNMRVQLAYLPYKRRDMMDDEHLDLYVSAEGNNEIRDIAFREEKKTRKHGLLNWLKPKVCKRLNFLISTVVYSGSFQNCT